jgi:hypothetical protein
MPGYSTDASGSYFDPIRLKLNGTEMKIATYGEMYEYGNTTGDTNNKADVYHGLHIYNATQTLAHISGWTFNQVTAANAISGTFASVSHAVSGTSVFEVGGAHGLQVGDIICMQTTGGTEYDGKARVSAIAGTTFSVTRADAVTRAGFWQQPSYLLAGAGSAGIYLMTFQVTGDSATTGEAFRVEACIGNASGITDQDHISADTTWSSGTDWRTITASGMITVAASDRVFLTWKGLSSTRGITWRHGSTNVVRIV